MEFSDEFVSRLKAANATTGSDAFDEAKPSAKAEPHRRSTLYTRSTVPARKSVRWQYILLLGAVAILSYGFGSWTHSTAIPPHPPNPAAGQTPADVVTVTVTKEVKVNQQVPSLPAACSDALQLAVDLEKQTTPIIDSGGRTTDILKQTRIAITEKNHQALNRLGSQVNDLENQTSGATQKLMELQDRLVAKLSECNKALGR